MSAGISAKAIYDSPERSSDLLYATGFHAPDPILYIELPREKILFVSPLEFDRARMTCGKRIKIMETDDKSPAEIISAVCRRNGVEKLLVPYSFPAGLASEVNSSGIPVAPSKSAFFPQREVKRRDEIAKIADALKIAEAAMRKAEKIIAESSVGKNNILLWHGEPLGSELIRRMIDMDISGGGAVAKDTIVSCGRDSAEPHNPGHGPIIACRPIIIDIFPRAGSGYWGDITRTFIKWRTTPRFVEIFNAVKAAGEKAFSRTRAGVPASDLHKTAFDQLRSKGFRTGKMKGGNCGFFHGLGHGVGLDIHEAPRVSPKNDRALKAGNVITIEPGLYYPDFGGVRIEDLLVVGRSRGEMLTDFHKNPLIE